MKKKIYTNTSSGIDSLVKFMKKVFVGNDGTTINQGVIVNIGNKPCDYFKQYEITKRKTSSTHHDS